MAAASTRPLVLSLLLAACAVPARAADEPTASLDPEVAKLVPAAVLYRRIPLPDDRNALPLLKRAFEQLAKSKDRADYEAESQALDWEAAPPKGRALRRLRDHLAKNRQALDLLGQAAALGRLQLPVIELGKQGANDLTMGFSRWHALGSLKQMRARLSAEEGKFAEAAQDLTDLLRLGGMLCRGEGTISCYLQGAGYQDSAAGIMRSLAARRAAPPEVLESLLASLEQCSREEDGFSQSLRVEFTSVVLPNLLKYPKDGGLEGAVEALVGMFRVRHDPGKINERVDLLKQRLLALHAGHPRPFDRAETIRLAGDLFAETLKQSQTPWPERRPVVSAKLKKELEPWPGALVLDLAGIMRLVLHHEVENISEEDLAGARERLKKVTNVLGKQIVAVQLGHMYDTEQLCFRRLSRLEASRAVVALCLYRARAGELPPSLGALVEAKILSRPPPDPFDGKPLKYDRARAIVWSAGLDGKDNGGTRPDQRAAAMNFLHLFRPTGAAEPSPPEKGQGVPPEADLVWDIPAPR